MKVIISVLGKDHPGIIAEVSTALFQHNINILDISQTILQDYFTMVMLADVTRMDISYKEMTDLLDQIAEKASLEIRMQRSEVFDAMHHV